MFLATVFIFISDQKNYNTLLQYLKNNNLKGLDEYPNTFNEAINNMNNFCAVPAAGTSFRHITRTARGIQFEQWKGPIAAKIL